MKNILLVCLLLLAVAYGQDDKFAPGRFLRKPNVRIVGSVLCSEFTEWCPTGYKCILWENRCHERPCKVFPICRPIKELERPFEICKKKGCSEDECVLMQSRTCKDTCYMNANCTPTAELQKCRGYICPNNFGCEIQWSRCLIRPCMATIYCFFNADEEELRRITSAESRRRAFTGRGSFPIWRVTKKN